MEANQYDPASGGRKSYDEKNKIEIMKEEKDGLDCLEDILSLAPTNNWAEMTEEDKQRAFDNTATQLLSRIRLWLSLPALRNRLERTLTQ